MSDKHSSRPMQTQWALVRKGTRHAVEKFDAYVSPVLLGLAFGLASFPLALALSDRLPALMHVLQ